MFFLGIDGGGTKTAFLLINENGDIIEAKVIKQAEDCRQSLLQGK